MDGVKDRSMGQEKAEIVLLHAFGFSIWQTTEEFQRRHPNLIHDPSRHRSVGRIIRDFRRPGVFRQTKSRSPKNFT